MLLLYHSWVQLLLAVPTSRVRVLLYPVYPTSDTTSWDGSEWGCMLKRLPHILETWKDFLVPDSSLTQRMELLMERYPVERISLSALFFLCPSLCVSISVTLLIK